MIADALHATDATVNTRKSRSQQTVLSPIVWRDTAQYTSTVVDASETGDSNNHIVMLKPIIGAGADYSAVIQNAVLSAQTYFELHTAATSTASFETLLIDRESFVQTVLNTHINRILKLNQTEGTNEEFELQLAEAFRKLINKFGRYALTAIDELLESGQVSPSNTVELLAVVGESGREERYRQLAINSLQRHLRSDIPKVRYGAILGFEALKHSSTVLSLRQALQRETVGMLQKMLSDLIRHLNT